MDRLTALRTFVLVAEHQSFAEAARRMRVSPTAASRGIAELENTLGVMLLRRTTRSVGLTPEGAAYVERCRRILDELDDADRSVRGEDSQPRGALIITAPLIFGRMHVLPVVTALLREHPALNIQLSLSDRVERLVEEGVDVAVRIADLTDSALHATRIAEVRRVLVASPAYLERRGMPGDVEHLYEHDLIASDRLAPNLEWRFKGESRHVVRTEPRLLTNNVETAIDAALDGVGITRTLSYQVHEHVQAGRLRYLLPETEPDPVPVSLVYQANRRRSPNLSAFIAGAQAYCRGRSFG